MRGTLLFLIGANYSRCFSCRAFPRDTPALKSGVLCIVCKISNYRIWLAQQEQFLYFPLRKATLCIHDVD